MASLLPFASRVEAAVASYISVQPVPDTDVAEWKRHFEEEMVSTVFS